MLRNNYTLVYHEIAYISLLSKNNRNFAKIAKTHYFWPYELIVRLFSEKNPKNMLRVVWAEKPETGLGFEIEQPQ